MNKRYKENEFTLCCKLAKYILIAICISYGFSVIVCAPFYADEPNLVFKEALMLSLMFDGFALIIMTLLDMLVAVVRFLSTHKVYILKVENRKIPVKG